MNNELIALLDYWERNRGLDRETLAHLIEDAVVAAARKAPGPTNELEVTINPKSGDIRAVTKLTVVEDIEDESSEIDVDRAQMRSPDAQLGDVIDWEVPPENFGRIVAQAAKQGIMQRMRQAERERVCAEYEDRIGEIIYGTVTRFDKGDVIISLDRTEGVLRQQDRAATEDYQVGDHICTVLVGVNEDRPGPILLLSRADPELVRRLFEREVTEIAEGIVEIRGVAREPGFRSKIAVHSNDSNVDPVGACVGIRGSRVKTVVRELSGEKVDIVRWDGDLKRYITQALQPAEIRGMDINEDTKTVQITVDNDQLSLAIGKRGQNARLTAKLTGYKIDIQEAKESREPTIEEKIEEAITALTSLPGIERDTAEILVRHGFLSAEGLREADISDLTNIEGIDQAVAAEIKDAVS